MYALILLLLLWVAPGTADAQETARPEIYPNRLALHLESADYNEADLDLVRGAGFSILVLDSLNSHTAGTLPEDFLIFYNIGIRHLLPSTIRDKKDTVLHELSEKVSTLSKDNLNRISAIGLFHLPMESIAFHQFSELVADTLRYLTDKPLYYHSYLVDGNSQSAAFDFVVAEFFSEHDNMETSAAPVTYFHPSEHYRSTILQLDQILNRSLQFDQSAIILPFGWVVQTLREQPGMALMLQEHVKGKPVTLPLPASERPEQAVNGQFIIFWLLIGSLIILIRYHPMIPQLVLRYYFNHTFFMQDIMEGRVRNPKGGLYFLGIHSLFSGLFIYCFLYSFYSAPGINVMAYFTGWGIWTQDPAVSFAVSAVILAILIHTISVSWLTLLIKDINHFYKAVNLYAWGLFVHILLTALLVVFSYFKLPLPVIYAMGGAYYVIWVSAFLVASVHGTKRLEKKRYIVLLSTFGVYLILAIALIILPFQSDKLIEIFQLAYQVTG